MGIKSFAILASSGCTAILGTARAETAITSAADTDLFPLTLGSTVIGTYEQSLLPTVDGRGEQFTATISDGTGVYSGFNSVNYAISERQSVRPNARNRSA